MDDLRDYQKVIINMMLDKKRLAIWLDMGMGKTRICIELLMLLMRPKTMVVCPKMAMDVWRQEFEKWDSNANIILIEGSAAKRKILSELTADVYIIGRDSLNWYVKEVGVKEFNCIILDEATSFKNISSKRFHAAKLLCAKADRVYELTGSPVANSYIDLFAQIFLLDFGQRLGRYITNYREEYFEGPVVNGFKVYKYPKSGAIDKINKLVQDITVSLKNEGYVKLPKRIDNIIRLRMDENLKNRYEMMKKNYFLSDNISASNVLTCIQKLCQLSNGFCYDNGGNATQFSQVKLEYMKEIFDVSTDNVLVFAMFKNDIDALRKIGATELNTTEKIHQWQMGNIKYAVAHPASLGYGLNLQYGGHVVFWYSLPWSLELFQQSNARLYRSGQQHTVTINCLITTGTIEEDIYRALQEKSLTQEVLLEACKLHIGNDRKKGAS